MRKFHSKILTVGLAFTLFGFYAGSQLTRATPPESPENPKLKNICLITDHEDRLIEFYELVLQVKAKRTGDSYAEFPTGAAVVAIFSAEAQEKYIPGSAEPGKNRSAILEFQVPDVDQEFARLQPLVKTWVKPPTTQNWGTRSIYFRDPDGNIVDFFTPVKFQ